ncbi:hypothetical protein [Nonomuraea sp. NPDC050643]|uniref:hypothetical protein n=1 Tax=Nonomuraea sp. NPDC050643 TaxID=3155660 RepID=UPI0033EE97A1
MTAPEIDRPYDADQHDPLKASVFRCAECGHGARLRAWTHVIAHGPVNAEGVIDDYDYTEDDDEVIEESVICQVHGENSIEKLIDGAYTATMIDGKYVSPTVALATALLDDPGVKYDMEHRELYYLARTVSGRDWKPACPQEIARFGELAEARAQQRAAKAKGDR